MGLTNECAGPKILAKIKIYALTRAELLFKVCYEIPCISEIRVNQGLSVPKCFTNSKTKSKSEVEKCRASFLSCLPFVS